VESGAARILMPLLVIVPGKAAASLDAAEELVEYRAARSVHPSVDEGRGAHAADGGEVLDEQGPGAELTGGNSGGNARRAATANHDVIAA